MKKLNLGCNTWHLPQTEWWINIDIDERVNPDIVLDVTQTLPFEDNSIDEIYYWHCIEHVYFQDNDIILSELKRVLKPNGIITITIPDTERWIMEYRKWTITREWLNEIVFGSNERSQQNHHQIFTKDLLIETMQPFFREIKELQYSPNAAFNNIAWQTILTANK